MSDHREYEEDREKKIIKQIEWSINRHLTWAALFLASTVGIIELLPQIKNISVEISIPKYVLYTLLIIAVLYSIHKSSIYLEDIANNEYKLNEYGWHFCKEDWAIFSKWLLEEGENQTWKRRIWVICLVYLFVILFSIFLLFDRLGINLINF